MDICTAPLEENQWPTGLGISIADSLFNNSSEGLCLTDAKRTIVIVNPTFCTLSGYSRRELIGNRLEMLRSTFHDPKYFDELWTTVAAKGGWKGELWNRHKTGELYAVRLNIAAICNGGAEVTHYLCMLADVTAAKVYLEQLEKKVNYDALTGLPNRILLHDRLIQAMAQARRTQRLLAVCYLDLDGFKTINDVHGHQAGDAVLVEVAKRLGRSVRAGDTVARLGGDEFAILLWGIKDSAECNHTLNRVVTDIASIHTIGDHTVELAASVGISLFPQDGDDATLLFAQADSAMYRAKASGGSRWRYFKS